MNKYHKGSTQKQRKMADGGLTTDAGNDFEYVPGGSETPEPSESFDPNSWEEDSGASSAPAASFNDRRDGNSLEENSSKPKPKPKPKPKAKGSTPMQRQGGGGGLAGGIADGLVVSGAGTPKNQTERDAKNAKDFEDTPLVRGAKSVGNTIKSWFDGSKSDAVKIADIPKSNRPGVYDNALNFGSGKSDSAPSPKTARISMDGVDPKTLRPPRAMANGGMVVDTLPKPRDPRHYGK